MTNESNIRLAGLTKLEQLQLTEAFEAAGQADKLSFETDDFGGAHGEAATATAIIILGAAALSVLGVWLSKSSKSETYEREVLVCDKEGNVLRAERIRITRLETDAPNPEVVKELAKIGKVDPEKLLSNDSES